MSSSTGPSRDSKIRGGCVFGEKRQSKEEGNAPEGALRPPTLYAFHCHCMDNISLDNTHNSDYPATHQATRRQRYRLPAITRISRGSRTERVNGLRALARNQHTAGKRRP